MNLTFRKLMLFSALTVLMGVGVVYALRYEFKLSSSPPSTGTLSVSAYCAAKQPDGSYEGSFVQTPVTVTGPESHNGTTTTDADNPLNFVVTPGQYSVSGTYGNYTPLAVTTNVSTGTYVKILLSFASSSSSSPPPTVEGVNDGLELTLTLEKTEYDLGEPINVTLTITNVSNQTINFRYVNPTFDFWVYNGTNNGIYQWSDYQAFSDMAWLIPLNAGESISETYVWQQTCNESVFSEGVPVSPGTYYIVGQIGLSHWLQTTPIQVTIVEP